jgi:hypothetical protein
MRFEILRGLGGFSTTNPPEVKFSTRLSDDKVRREKEGDDK